MTTVLVYRIDKGGLHFDPWTDLNTMGLVVLEEEKEGENMWACDISKWSQGWIAQVSTMSKVKVTYVAKPLVFSWLM